VRIAADRLVFVDVETAESDAGWTVIQVAAVAVSGRLRELAAFEAKLAVGRPVRHSRFDAETWKREGQPAREVARAFATFLREHATVPVTPVRGRPYRVAQVVAHNAEFDGAMLRAWFDQAALFLPGHFRVLCTVQRAAWLFREAPHLEPPNDYKLGTLCRHFGITYRAEDAHDALNDARAAVELYREMRAVIRRSAPARSGRAGRSGGSPRTADRRRLAAADTRPAWSSPQTPKPTARTPFAPPMTSRPRRP
jgi:DNA polymerase III epsilon subunit-like protein